MAKTTMEQQFRETVIAKLSEIQTKIGGIESHLITLNGSVVTLKGEQERIKIRQAKEDERGRIATAREKWMWGLIGSACLLFIEHLGAVVGPWFR